MPVTSPILAASMPVYAVLFSAMLTAAAMLYPCASARERMSPVAKFCTCWIWLGSPPMMYGVEGPMTEPFPM